MAKTSTTEKPARTRRTAAQRAQADLDKATARMAKADAAAAAAHEKLSNAVNEQQAAQRFYDYVSRNPDLPAQDVVPEDASELSFAAAE